ncbi:MAG: S8 family serine peptidase, partial [Bacteroidia bacterium]|nr:S8 family serine peptidase [Bacteroidia bacterium]
MFRTSFIIVALFFVLISSYGQVQISKECVLKLESFENSNSSHEIALLAKVNDNYSKYTLAEENLVIGSQIGDFITIRTNRSAISFLRKYQGFDLIQVAKTIKPNLARTTLDMRVDSVRISDQLDLPYSGKDVIIGITDWGFDYTHPNFYDTALQHTRILAAWDQFKTSGPPPSGYNYGTVYEGEAELLSAQSDTFNVYQYATHGSHVAGIAGGSGAGTEHRGIAYESSFLFVTFLVDEAAVLDGFAWMKEMADKHEKRLVVNMSWGLYYIGSMDGKSVLSQAIDEYSKQGVVFVTSAGNNGDVNFHIKKEFENDTLRSLVEFYPYGA